MTARTAAISNVLFKNRQGTILEIQYIKEYAQCAI